VSIQHELVPGVRLDATYLRRDIGNHFVQDNLLVQTSDYDTYCIAAPTDARLGSVSGSQICGLYDINPSKFGLQQNVINFADKYGKVKERWQGVDVNVAARLKRGLFVNAGVAVANTLYDNCAVQDKVNNPAGGPGGTLNALPPGPGFIASGLSIPASPDVRFCHMETPWLTTVTGSGAVPLPWNLQVSAVLQNTPGPMITASYAAPVAAIAPSLGRPLSGGARNATIPLIKPGTVYADRITQTDFRAARSFNFGSGRRVQGTVDIYNVFNVSSILGINTTYGPNFLRPQSVVTGRTVKFGAQLDF
jgi:hypothetical protein